MAISLPLFLDYKYRWLGHFTKFMSRLNTRDKRIDYMHIMPLILTCGPDPPLRLGKNTPPRDLITPTDLK